jgi:hypothetical protein
MKNIPLSALPTFYGKSSEDPDTFLFEFDILCRSYNYLQDAQKLKLFPATLKDSALRWFMGLGESSIRSWEDMKAIFLKKYQDYCKSKDSRNDIFKIQQLEDESLEDYMERFAYTSQKSKYHDLPDDAVRTLFLKGILEEYLETLNLMASGDISHKPFTEICEMCRNYSRSRAKTGKSVRDPYSRNLKTVSSGGITRVEIGNLLENFKTDILSTIGSQLDTLNIKKKQEEENATMCIFCPRCRRKHSSRECPLDNISVCGFCTEDHPTEKFPSLPGLLAIYRSGDPGESSYAPRRPWQPRSQPTYQDLPPQVPPYYQQPQQWNSPNWKNWSPQYASHHPWLQGWRGGHTQGNTQAPPVPMPTHPYPQFPPNIQQLFPGFVPPPLPPIPQQPQQYQNTSSPRPTLLPAQPVPNPNNKPTQPLHNVELQTFPTYVISLVPLHEIQLRSGKVLDRQRPSVVIREEEEDETPEQPMDDTKWEDVIIPKDQETKASPK